MKSWFFSFLIIVLLTISACSSKEINRIKSKGGEKIKVAELNSLFAGSKVNMVGYGQDADLTFHINGKISAQNTEGEKNDGIWKVDSNDNLCIKFKRWGGGDKICYQVYKIGDEYTFFRKKSKQYDVKITARNFERSPQGESSTSSASSVHYTTPSTSSPSGDIKKTDGHTEPVITQQTKEEIGLVVRDLAKNCPGCNLMKANLAGANLSNANLGGANLAEADLRYANLRRANLKGANLYKADFTGADIGGIILEGANLQGAIGLRPIP